MLAASAPGNIPHSLLIPGTWNAERPGMSTSNYIPNLSCGTRVRFIGQDHHPKSDQHCTIIGILPNPSKRALNQWYDVRFDDFSMGRFVERYLVRVNVDDEETAA